MARFPRIDQPCPLAPEAQKRIQGSCGHCGKTVHALDGMSVAQRVDLMRKAPGSVCVSYTLTASLGAALALSMAGPVSAGGAETGNGTSQLPATSQSIADIADSRSSEPDAAPAHSPIADDMERIELVGQMEFVGGISRPGEVEWIDDDTLPDLPMRRE